MKKTICLLSLFIIVCSCGDDDNSSNQEETNEHKTLHGTWKVVSDKECYNKATIEFFNSAQNGVNKTEGFQYLYKPNDGDCLLEGKYNLKIIIENNKTYVQSNISYSELIIINKNEIQFKGSEKGVDYTINYIRK